MRRLTEKDMKALFVLLGLFVVGLTIANIIAGIKLVNLWGMVVPSAFIVYALLTFPITDIVGEIYGKKVGKWFVIVGILTQLTYLFLIWVAGMLPALTPEMQELFQKTFSLSGRIVLASLIAFAISQTHDVWAFHFWGKRTKGKYLWLRNNASTMVSQLLDTVAFITIGFYGVVPTAVLYNMIVSQYALKLVVALLDTPIVYAGSTIVKAYTGRKSVFER